MFRTLLFVPANDGRKIKKALQLDVNVVILDLEDACAISEKETARETLVNYISIPRKSKLYIRVNGFNTRYFYKDLKIVIKKEVDGIVIPMVEDKFEMRTIEWFVGNLEKEQGLQVGTLDILPIIETAKGLSNLQSILENSTRVKRVAFGAGDFTNDLGIEWSKDGMELLHARSKIVMDSRVAKIEPPIDTVYIDLEDMENLERETKQAKKMGFQGKLLIHPKQIEPVKRIFNPTKQEVQQAKEIIEAFKNAELQGSSSIRVGEQFVDYPIYEKAKKILEMFVE